jgi:hypothetical protein
MEYREPDQYYNEQLTTDTLNYSSNDLEQCLELSMLQYIEKSMVDQQIKYSELYSKYKQILLKYKRLNYYDSTIRDFTSYIEPIMDEYSKHGIPVKLDDDTYKHIISIVNSIRLTEEEKELMNQLFSKY